METHYRGSFLTCTHIHIYKKTLNGVTIQCGDNAPPRNHELTKLQYYEWTLGVGWTMRSIGPEALQAVTSALGPPLKRDGKILCLKASRR